MSTTASGVELERQGAWDVTCVTDLLFGGAEAAEEARAARAVVEADPVLGNVRRLPFLSRTEAFLSGWERMKRFRQLLNERGAGPNEMISLFRSFNGLQESVLQLALGVCAPAIMSLGSDEQVAEYLPNVLNMTWIVAYAQTELGHGSNVKGLETTATFDPVSDEWDIHSPTLTSTKWWVGGLGLTATHAIVFARLCTKGTDHGVHPFMVPLRSLEDHSLLPGVTCFDIGPKFGFNGVDNGAARFDHVRVPRSALLSRHYQVDANGVYTKPPSSVVTYGAMLFVRSQLVQGTGWQLARAVTIATRYSMVRRQFGGVDGGPERKVLDYPMQQFRIFVPLATSYAHLFTAQWMKALHESASARVQAGDLSELAETHASSSGLKALCTTQAVAGMEACRRACGGHGYSSLSGIDRIMRNVTHWCTAEGENFVLVQQTARYLFKLVRADTSLPAGSNAAYLVSPQRQQVLSSTCAVQSMQQWLDGRGQCAVLGLQRRVARLMVDTVSAMDTAVASGHSSGQAWDDHVLEMSRISDGHCELILATCFLRGLHAAEEAGVLSTEALAALGHVCALFCLATLEKVAGDLMGDGWLSMDQRKTLSLAVKACLRSVRTHACALTDAYGFTDTQLNSALGRRDGRVYEALYEWAQEEPLNQRETWQHAYVSHLHPLFQAKL